MYPFFLSLLLVFVSGRELIDTLGGKSPRNESTECGSTILHQFDGCCSQQVVLSMPAANLNGHLPSNFSAAQNYTDFSDNPHLCGLIRHLPSRPVPITSSDSLVNLRNSSVKLDLAAIGAANKYIGPQIVAWLGTDSLSSANLDGKLPATAAYQVCMLLTKGQLRMRHPTYCKKKTRAHCECKAKAEIFSSFKGEFEWDTCHTTKLDLKFNSTDARQVALLKYNTHMQEVDAAFTCGDAGLQYRRRVMILTLGITGSACIMFCLIACCFKTCCHSTDNKQHGVIVAVFLIAVYIGLHAIDTYTDFVYLNQVAEAGNRPALLLLGWLFASPLLITAILQAFVMLPALCILTGGQGSTNECCSLCCLTLLSIFGLFVNGIAIFIMGMSTFNLLKYVDHHTTSTRDCVLYSRWLIGFASVQQLGMMILGVVLKVRDDPALNSDKGVDESKPGTAAADLMFLLFESIPQLVMQTVFWRNGGALVSTTTYVRSAVTGMASAVWSIMSIVSNVQG